MDSTKISFNEQKLGQRFVGCICIDALDDNNVVISDWTGTLFQVRLNPLFVVEKIQVANRIDGKQLINNCIRGLSVSKTKEPVVAVATGGAYAALWKVGTSDVSKVHSETGPVTCVAWLKEAEILLIGTGMHELGTQRNHEAILEVWRVIRPKPECMSHIALPGTSVDCLFTDFADGYVLAASGLKNQKSGFLALLNSHHFRAMRYTELPFAMSSKVFVTEDRVTITDSSRIISFRMDDGSKAWEKLTEGTIQVTKHFRENFIFSSGEIITALSGKPDGSSSKFNNCQAMTSLPNGKNVGVSPEGRIGIWG